VIDIRDLHADLRKQLLRYPLVESLLVIYNYVQNLQFNRPIDASIEIDTRIAKAPKIHKGYYEWDLDILCRELLQHAPIHGLFSLSRWAEYSATINALRKLENQIAERMGDALAKNILMELGRIAHHQFPWQTPPNNRTLTRYYKIFSHPLLIDIFHRRLGVAPRDYYILGLVLLGHFMTRFSLAYPLNPSDIGITVNDFKSFAGRLSAPLSTQITLAQKSTIHDENFSFAQNPLRSRPLIHLSLNGRHHLIAPIPTFLFRQITEGAYYAMVGELGFDHAFGNSFQEYIGDVGHAVLDKRRFTIDREKEYYSGSDRKDSIDWIVSDGTAHLFVECKTKRLRLSSKFAFFEIAPLEEDLEKMAAFVVQTYKTIADAKAGLYPHWIWDGAPIYPVVVTLEDWYTISPTVTSYITDQVADQLSKAGIDPAMAKEVRFTIASCADFELLLQVVDQLNINAVMSRKADEKTHLWNVSAFLRNNFKREIAGCDKTIFSDALVDIYRKRKT